MKLIKAEITGFGHYRQRTFDFSAGNQLFFGRNEVGKSTLYQFIQVMLFGFPKKSLRRRDYTPQDGAAYGGKLWFSLEPYGEVLIERYRQVNKGKAKVWVNEQEGDEKLLASLLAPLTQDVFQDVFTFQQEQLSQIDRLQEKELHAALISLGISGSKQLMGKIQDYHKMNQQMFKPRGRRLPLNQRLMEWQSLKEKIHQKEAQEANVQQAYQQVAAFTEKQQVLNEDLNALQKQQQQLNQQKMNWSLYEEWQQLRTLKMSRISEEEQRQLRQFHHEYQQLSDEIHKKEDELARLEQGQESDRYFFYLDQEGKIQEILKQKVTIARLIDEQQRLATELAQADAELAQLAERWGWQQQRPPQTLDPQIFEFLDRVEALAEKQHQQELRLDWLREKSQQLEEEITQLEKKHPELLQPGSNPSLLIAGLGAGLLVLSFVLPSPLKGLLLVSGLAGLIAGGGWYFYQKSNASAQIKPLWQEKLLQLDAQAAEIAAEEAQLTNIQQEKAQLLTYLQPSFGSNTDYHSWRHTIQEFEAAAKTFHETAALQAAAQQKQTAIEKEMQTIDEQFAVFADWLPLENKDLQEKSTLLETFAEKMQAVKMTRLQQPSTLLAQQLKRSKDERQALFTEYQNLLERFGLEHPTEIPLWIKQWEQQQKQLERKAELTKLLTPIFPKRIKEEELLQQLATVQLDQEALQQQQTRLLEEKQRVQLQIEQLQIDGILDELYQEESRLLSEIRELALTWSTNQVMAACLSDLATELSEQQLPQLLQQASHYFQLLTNGRYQKVALVEGLLHAVSDQASLDIYTLSTGTKDQLIMAVRFAYLSLQGSAAVSPVIIDDGWLHYDSERKAQLAQLFAEFGKKHQVICLSSDQEMVSYYQSLQQPVVEIKQRM